MPPLSSTVSGLFLLLRPVNCSIAALSVWVGACTAGTLWPTTELAVAAVATASIAAAGNIFNDFRDVEIDRINRPGRPLPAGLVSSGLAQLEAAVLALAGLAAAWWLGPSTGLIATTALLLLFAYSLYLKITTIWGNLVVAIVAAAAFPFGAIATGTWGRSWIPAGFALLFHLGREIVKDLEDVAGDDSVGARTLPLRWGASVARWSTTLIFLILIGLTFLPGLRGIYGIAYFSLVIPMDLVLIAVLWRLWPAADGSSSEGSAGSAANTNLSLVLKGCMLLGLLAIVAGEAL